MKCRLKKSSAKRFISVAAAVLLSTSICSCTEIESSQDQGSETRYDLTTNVQEASNTSEDEILKYCVIDSTSNNWIYLPFHRVENVPTDFIVSVENNPIDSDWNALAQECEWDYALLRPHLKEYSQLWNAELEVATDDLCLILGDDFKGSVTQYAQARQNFISSFYQCLEEAIGGADQMSGSFTAYAIEEMKLNELRQTVFFLKYLRYLAEIATNDTNGKSKTYVYSATAPLTTSDFRVITETDGLVIRIFASPSLTNKTGNDFVLAMANNPIDRSMASDAQAWSNELAQVSSYLMTTFCIDTKDMCEQYSEMILQEKSIRNALSALFEMSIDADFEYDAERQLVLYLKYLAYVFETEYQADDANLSLSFGVK